MVGCVISYDTLNTKQTKFFSAIVGSFYFLTVTVCTCFPRLAVPLTAVAATGSCTDVAVAHRL